MSEGHREGEVQRSRRGGGSRMEGTGRRRGEDRSLFFCSPATGTQGDRGTAIHCKGERERDTSEGGSRDTRVGEREKERQKERNNNIMHNLVVKMESTEMEMGERVRERKTERHREREREREREKKAKQ